MQESASPPIQHLHLAHRGGGHQFLACEHDDAAPALVHGDGAGRQPQGHRAYAAALAVSVDTALLDLRGLVDRGLVRAEDTTKDRRYVLAGDAGAPAIHRTTL